MALEVRLPIGLAFALAMAFLLTPVAIRAAGRFDFYDKPVGYKGHATPTPYLGGAAVVLAFALAIGLFAGDLTRTAPLLGGVLILWVVGTIDDRRTVSPGIRVAIEVALATVIFALGHGWDLGSGPLSFALTVVWVVTVVNAFNLFDNMDGAASSMAAVVCAGVAILAVVIGDRWLAVAAIALTGACIGFLPHNLSSPGARIFLGDGGSMPIGFAVAALVMVGASGAAPAWQSLLIGLLLVGVPALDTCLVMFSRARRRISILTGGQDHLTHRARQRLRTARAVAVALGGTQAVISALALLAIEGGSELLVGATLLYVVALGASIALLDSRSRLTPAAGEVRTAPPRLRLGERRVRLPDARQGLLAALGLVIGLGPLADGYYDSEIWVPAGVVLIVVLVAVLIARPPRLSLAGGLAVAGLVGLAGWALLSASWAESAEQAVVAGNRYAVYAALLGAYVVLLRDRADAAWLMGSLGLAGLVVLVVVVSQLTGEASPELFRGGRLNEPLGYINGQASFFLMAMFPCLALAEQRRSSIAAGAGLGLTVLLAALVLLSQSRGAALALVISVLVLLAVVPGRIRRAWGIVAAGAAVSLAAPRLLDVSPLSFAGELTAAELRATMLQSIAIAIGAGVLWGALSAVVARLGRSGDVRIAPVRRAATATLLAGVAALLVVGIARGGSIAESVRTEYRAFTQVDATGAAVVPSDTTRLISGSGTRYDYWRIAADVWGDAPVRGIGGGNYDVPYFARRATTEDVRQPHSLQMQVLSETGLVGGGLLALLLAGLILGARRWARAARRSRTAACVTVAAMGSVTAFLVHTSVDWMHLLPGLTGMALAGLAVLVMGAPERRPPRPRLLVAVAVSLLIGVAGLSLTRQGVAEHFRRVAQSALAERPAKALVEADRSLRLDAQAVSTYYVKAAAFARYGQADAAERTLREAAAKEPSDFVTWTLLGDFATRRGRPAQAREHYRRALALNPRNASLRRSLADPEAALP